MKDKRLLSVGVILLSSLLLIGCSDKANDVDEVDSDPTELITYETEDDQEWDRTGINEDSTPVVPNDADLEGFSTAKQQVGVEGEAQFELESMRTTDEVNYYRIAMRFGVTTEDYNAESIPLVTAEYSSAKSAVVLRIAGLSKDSSGIGTMQSRDISKNGLTRVYHAVSGTAGVAVYEIGSTDRPEFKLSRDSADDSVVYLDIKYPNLNGDTTTSNGKNDEFSTTRQGIDGGTSDNGAGISRFSWLSSGGVLSVVFEVKGDSQEPTPEAYAEYVDGKLNLVYVDLSSPMSRTAQSYTVAGAGRVSMEPSGTTYTYIFEEVADKPFRLNRNLSPNQVVLEIKLR